MTDTAKQVKDLRRKAKDLVEQNTPNDADAIINELLSIENGLISGELSITRDVVEIASTLKPTEKYAQLEQLHLKGIECLKSNKSAQVGDHLIAWWNLGALYQRAGATDRWNQMNSSILSVAANLTELPDRLAVGVFENLGGMLAEAGFAKQAAILYGQVHRFLVAHPTEQSEDQRAKWLMSYATLLAKDGQYVKAQTVLEPIPDKLRGRGLNEIAGIGLSQQSDATESLYSEALRVAESVDEPDDELLWRLYHNLAMLNLQKGQSGATRAEELMERAIATAKKLGMEGSALYVEELSQLAAIAIKTWKLDRVAGLLKESVTRFESVADTDDDVRAEFFTEAGYLYLTCAQFGDAIDLLNRALKIREKMRADQPVRLADTLSTLALAHFKSGELTEASGLYSRAIDLRISDSQKSPQVA